MSNSESPFVPRRARRRGRRPPVWLRRLPPVLVGLVLILASLWLGQAMIQRMTQPAAGPPAEPRPRDAGVDQQEPGPAGPPDGLADDEKLSTFTGRPDLAELYRIQVGAFFEESNAQRLVDQLKTDGLPALMHSHDPYQVIIGYAASRQAALIWSERLPDGIPVYLAPTPLVAGDAHLFGAGSDSPLPGTLALMRTLISAEARWWDRWLTVGEIPPVEEAAAWLEQVVQTSTVIRQMAAQGASDAAAARSEDDLLRLLAAAEESLELLLNATTPDGPGAGAAMGALTRIVEEYTALAQRLSVSTKNMVN